MKRTARLKASFAKYRRRVQLLWRQERWFRVMVMSLAVPVVLLFFFTGYYYVRVSGMINERLLGERDTVLPRVLARPLELRVGQSLTDRQLIDRLNDLGYTQRQAVEHPGEFAVGNAVVVLQPRGSELNGQTVRVSFQRPAPAGRRGAASTPARASDHIERLELGGKASDRLALDAPVLSSLTNGEREKRRPVSLKVIPPRMVQAVLAIEDRRFYEHPGIDPIGMGGAVFAYLTGRRAYMAGGSTITQQLVRNVFLPKFEGMSLQAARARSIRRKLLEVFVSLVLTTKASKDEILELYLNNVPLGQRGSFAIYGVAEAARLFFGKDVSNVTVAEAATIAGVIQSPSALSPFNNPTRSKERRNLVIQAMVDEGYVKRDQAERSSLEPIVVVQRALEAEAPYFVDFVGQTVAEQYPGLTSTTTQAVDVYTTLDLHLQRLAQDAVRNGLGKVDQLLSRRKRKGKAEAALIAVDPKTGEILAFVGGRSYNQSQFNRAIVARRQPGSVFKPFVYLTAFEQAMTVGRLDITPASIAIDEPETFEFDDQVWTPENYEGTYDGPITYRRALAHSRNLATIHVAQTAGFASVANLWKRLGVGNPPKAYPSIALGVFEATPYEIATAYTVFPNLGTIRPLSNVLKVTQGGANVTKPSEAPKKITRPDTAFLVTNMMRSVMNEGTGAGARSAGFTLDAAGKTGTTNDLRDAWFAGFTPELLTVVWVGFDDNQPVGLSGAQAALPIWTEFMKQALAGRPSVSFEVPSGITFVQIDPETGLLYTPNCPKVFNESFIVGTEPHEYCELHSRPNESGLPLQPSTPGTFGR